MKGVRRRQKHFWFRCSHHFRVSAQPINASNPQRPLGQAFKNSKQSKHQSVKRVLIQRFAPSPRYSTRQLASCANASLL